MNADMSIDLWLEKNAEQGVMGKRKEHIVNQVNARDGDRAGVVGAVRRKTS